MFEDDSNPTTDNVGQPEQDSSKTSAGSAGQVSDITTESEETQAEAATSSAATGVANMELSENRTSAPTSEAIQAPKGFLNYTEPQFDGPLEALEDLSVQLNKSMLIDEDLIMSYLFKSGISESYYRLWADDAGQYFRSLSVIRLRMERMRAKRQKAASKSSSEKSASEKDKDSGKAS